MFVWFTGWLTLQIIPNSQIRNRIPGRKNTLAGAERSCTGTAWTREPGSFDSIKVKDFFLHKGNEIDDMSSQFSPTRSCGVGSRPVMGELKIPTFVLFVVIWFKTRLYLREFLSVPIFLCDSLQFQSIHYCTCDVLRRILFHNDLLDWLKQKKGLQTFPSTNIQCMKLSSG